MVSVVLAVGVLAAPPASAARAGRDAGGTQARSGLPWSSGVTPVGISGTQAERFGEQRGAPVDNVVVYPGRETWATMRSLYWTQALPSYFDPAEDDLVVTLPLWPQNRSVKRTGTRKQWRSLASGIASVDPDAYVRLGWEMNVDQFYWALRPGNHRAWQRAFTRAARLMATTCPSCQVVWNPNHGRGGTGFDQRKVFKKVKRHVDVYAIDSYDIYPPVKDAASRRQHLRDYGQLDESLAFARRHQMPFAVPEWGIACNGPGCQWAGHAGGDNPAYVRMMLRWFRNHASSIAFESYFDEVRPAIRSSLYTRPMGPRAGRAYRAGITAARATPAP